MSSVGQTTIPDPGRTWCYRRCGSAHPNRTDIASGLGLRSFLSTTFLAEQAHEPIDIDSVVHRRNEITDEIFKTPAATLEGLAAQARVYMIEHKIDRSDEQIGAALAEGITRLAAR
jgi:hypothetical protein